MKFVHKNVWFGCAVLAAGMLIIAKVNHPEPVRSRAKDVEVSNERKSKFFHDYFHAPALEQQQALWGITDVQVVVDLNGEMKGIVSEREVKTKLELALRRNRIPIDPRSNNQLLLQLNGMSRDHNPNEIVFVIRSKLGEFQTIQRGLGEFRNALVVVWDRGGVMGTMPKRSANEYLLKQVEKEADYFANDYLAANALPDFESLVAIPEEKGHNP